MDEEIRPLLKEIASELRARNDIIREQQRKADDMRSEVFSRFPFGQDKEGKPEFAKPDFSFIERDHNAAMQRIKDDADRDRAQQSEFQEALLSEIRRLNHNLEELIQKGSG